MDKIRIANMAFYGHHGVADSERDLGGKFHIDVELSLDLSSAGHSDDVRDTVDYQRVYEVVAEVERSRRFRLLEALASSAAEAILERFEVEEVTIRVRKTGAPLGGLIDYAEVELTRRRGE
ncbi:MAG: dihydroneopterin aldolase [Armatimonadetes bacterium]|nr:dihydroneopterin aldolase [Armatimonadota bacterium]